jgi:hypothetical protein
MRQVIALSANVGHSPARAPGRRSLVSQPSNQGRPFGLGHLGRREGETPLGNRTAQPQLT